MPEIHDLNEPTLFIHINDLRAAITPLDAELARLRGERSSALKAAAANIGSEMLGRSITAKNISPWNNSDVLVPMNAHNGMQSSSLAPGGLRTYSGARSNYYRSVLMTNPDSVTGEVVGFDLPDYSLVIKPRSFRKIMVSRYWVKLIDGAGNPLVELTPFEK